MSFLEISALSKTYRQSADVETIALQPTTLSIEKGEFIVISGPSGSGKTTLLNLIGGLEAPSGGSVVLDGLNLTALPEKKMARIRLFQIGFIFQAYNLIPVLSARENIDYLMILQGLPKAERAARIASVADQLGIAQLLDKRPAELSGGQQQRVAIARALVGHPKLLLADEPTANLDSKTGAGLMELLHQLGEEGMTILISSHDPMVIAMAKRPIILKDGAVVAS